MALENSTIQLIKKIFLGVVIAFLSILLFYIVFLTIASSEIEDTEHNEVISSLMKKIDLNSY